MNITAKVNPIDNETNLKGFATIAINEQIAIHNIRIMEGKNGLYTQMPSVQDNNGDYKQVAYPITADARNELNNAVMEAYQNALTGKEQERSELAPIDMSIRVSVKENAFDNNIKANCKLIIDEQFVIDNVRVMDGKNGLFVQMPNRQKDDEFKDIVHPITADFRNQIIDSVMDKYNQKDMIIGNTPYNQLGDKSDLRFTTLNNQLTESVCDKLSEQDIAFSGKINNNNTATISINKADLQSLKDIIDVAKSEVKPEIDNLSNFQNESNDEINKAMEKSQDEVSR